METTEIRSHDKFEGEKTASKIYLCWKVILQIRTVFKK